MCNEGAPGQNCCAILIVWDFHVLLSSSELKSIKTDTLIHSCSSKGDFNRGFSTGFRGTQGKNKIQSGVSFSFSAKSHLGNALNGVFGICFVLSHSNLCICDSRESKESKKKVPVGQMLKCVK